MSWLMNIQNERYPQTDSDNRRQTDSSDEEEERPNLSVQTDSCLQLSKHLWEEEEKELEKKNLCFSPLSIYVILSLIASGSKGRTLEQMLEFLKSDNIDRLNSIGSQLIESVSGGRPVPVPSPSPSVLQKRKRTTEGGGGPILYFMSGIWVEKSWALKPQFKEIVRSIYKAKAKSVDFSTNKKRFKVKEKVNKWVEKKTNGLIKELLPQGSIDDETRLVLGNAIYFKGQWELVFLQSKTKTSEFHLLDGVGSVQVPFMTNHENQFVSCFKGFKVLRLQYKQASTNDLRLSMYIFLPNERDGLGNLIQRVNSDSGFLDHHIPKKRIELRHYWIPKFKISYSFEASKVLKDMGIKLAFDRDKAELNKMVLVNGKNERLYVSNVHHKCSVEVDEVGTEAVASVLSCIAIPYCRRLTRPPPVDFVADHPFMFFIRDDETGVVLFMGHVLNPLLKTG